MENSQLHFPVEGKGTASRANSFFMVNFPALCKLFLLKVAAKLNLPFTTTPPKMVRRFFSTKQILLPDGNESNHILMLLSGPPSCGKTSLLFQYAVNSATLDNSSTENAFVTFICNRRRLENKPPFLSQGIDSSSEIFKRIQMKYVDDDEGIKKYFAAFHLHENFPAAVIIDDFGDFFHESNCQKRYNNHRGRDLAMVRTLSLCRDAIIHANERMFESGRSCKLLLSDTHHGETPRSLFIYKRWVSSIFTIKDDGPGLFLLGGGSSSSSCSNSLSAGEAGRKNAAKYSIALQYLMLEEIIEETD